MFGFNKTEPLRQNEDGQSLFVKDVFPTIQGEGPLTGVPALFVRLGGCNLKCWFCDTDFEVEEPTTLIDLLDRIEQLGGEYENMNHIVITGGEPMIQNLLPLVHALNDQSWRIQIETAGTTFVPGLFDHLNLEEEINTDWQHKSLGLVCSPKTPHVHADILKHCRDWKYIVRAGEVYDEDGLPMFSTQVRDKEQRLFRPPERRYDRVWVQPAEEYDAVVNGLSFLPSATSWASNKERTERNTSLAARIAMQYGYRLSLQTHKIIGLP
jgi:organic radical activating enzyme